MAARASGHYGQCPPLKNKSKEKAMQLSYNSEKNVNRHIQVCFARRSEVRDSIISHIVDLSLVRKHQLLMSFSGQTRFCPWNWLPDMRNSKDQKPNADKRGIRLAEIDKFEQGSFCPLLTSTAIQQQQRPQQL